MRERPAIAVVKIGGSVLTGLPAFHRVASFLEHRLRDGNGERLVVVVSAEYGVTDALLATANDMSCGGEGLDGATLDLLWSTGELRSVALLTLALHARGIRAAGLNVHQTGLVAPDGGGSPGRAQLQALRLRAALATHDIVVVPGFLARTRGDAVASLGRGGSDLTAVLLAAGLGAARCELVKDVPGYFDTDPNVSRDARPIPFLTFDAALEMAREGCELVQPAALDAARASSVPLVICAIDGAHTTYVSHDLHAGGSSYGVLDTDDSRGAAVGAGHRLADRPDLPDVHLRAGGAGVSQGV